MDRHRVERVSEALKEELSEIVGYELADPRLEGVSVTDVHVSPDGRHATVRVAVPQEDGSQRRALAGLEHARTYLRRELAARLALRRVPELHFSADAHPEAEDRVRILLERARKSKGRAEN